MVPRTERSGPTVGADWWRSAVIYQVYPRSFQDSNGDGVGDLPGITARLGHLNGRAGGLGIDAVWLSPFYPSPMVDFGYDIADHCAVDPCFGTLADFDELVREAHRREIRVLVDFVPNHTSDRHPWFENARASLDAAKRDWYVWADAAPDGGPPNNWLSSFERVGPAWTLDDRTGQYYLHSYTPQQPDLNWWNPEVQEAMEDVLRFWFERGVDGVRIDVPHRLLKDRALRDNPPEVAHLRRAFGSDPMPFRNLNHPEVHRILRSFRRVIDEYPGRMAVGEVGVVSLADMVRYYGRDDELHLAFNFGFWQQPWSASAFAMAVDALEAALPPGASPCWALSNHDLSRIATRYGDGGRGAERARVAAMMLLTLRGTAFLYYGDEIGMTDVAIDGGLAADPDGRDGARTPMQWNGNTNAGFTSSRPWLPLPTSARVVNVDAQRADPGSLLNLHRRLIALRRPSPALRQGSYVRLTDDDRVLAYLRSYERERLLVALNFSTDTVVVDLAGAAAGPVELAGILESTHAARPDTTVSGSLLRLAGNEGVVARIR